MRQTLFTRPGIYAGIVGFIVCPTSWTEDEDFDLVIDAVPRLEERAFAAGRPPASSAASRHRDPGHRRRRAPRGV
jgi:hypothetical protein